MVFLLLSFLLINFLPCFVDSTETWRFLCSVLFLFNSYFFSCSLVLDSKGSCQTAFWIVASDSGNIHVSGRRGTLPDCLWQAFLVLNYVPKAAKAECTAISSCLPGCVSQSGQTRTNARQHDTRIQNMNIPKYRVHIKMLLCVCARACVCVCARVALNVSTDTKKTYVRKCSNIQA